MWFMRFDYDNNAEEEGDQVPLPFCKSTCFVITVKIGSCTINLFTVCKLDDSSVVQHHGFVNGVFIKREICLLL